MNMQGCPHHLELRQTSDKGWALYTLDAIAANTFVTEYTGFIRRATSGDSATTSSARGSNDMQAGHEDDFDAASNPDEWAFDMALRPCSERFDLPLLPVLLHE